MFPLPQWCPSVSHQLFTGPGGGWKCRQSWPRPNRSPAGGWSVFTGPSQGRDGRLCIAGLWLLAKSQVKYNILKNLIYFCTSDFSLEELKFFYTFYFFLIGRGSRWIWPTSREKITFWCLSLLGRIKGINYIFNKWSILRKENATSLMKFKNLKPRWQKRTKFHFIIMIIWNNFFLSSKRTW